MCDAANAGYDKPVTDNRAHAEKRDYDQQAPHDDVMTYITNIVRLHHTTPHQCDCPEGIYAALAGHNQGSPRRGDEAAPPPRTQDYVSVCLGSDDCPGGLPWDCCYADDCGVDEFGVGCELAAHRDIIPVPVIESGATDD